MAEPTLATLEPPPPRPRGVWSGLCLVLAVQAAILAQTLRHSGLMQDDFIHFWIFREYQHLTWAYLTRDAFGHLAVSQRLLMFWVLHYGHASWVFASGLTIFFNLLASYMAFRLARLLVGSTRWAVVASAACAFSPLWAGCFWLASEADSALPLPLLFLILELSVRRILGGRRLCSAAAGICLALELTSRERPAVVPAMLALFVLALLPSGAKLGAMFRALLKLWDLWLCFLIPLSGYAVFIFTKGQLIHQMKSPTTAASGPGQVFEYVFKTLSRVTLPSLVGFLPNQWSPKAPVELATNLGVLALVVVTIVLLPRAWRGWAWLLSCFVISLAPVGLGRGGNADAFAVEARYSVDLIPFICLTVAFLGREVQQGNFRASFRSWSESVRPSVANWSVALCLAGYALLSLQSITRYREQWSGGAAGIAARLRHFLTTLSLPSNTTLLASSLPPRLNLQNPPDVWAMDWTFLSLWVPYFQPQISIVDPHAAFVAHFNPYDWELKRFKRSEAHEIAFSNVTIDGADATSTAARPCVAAHAPAPRRFSVPLMSELSGAKFALLEISWGPGERPFWVHPTSASADQQWQREAPEPVGQRAEETAVIVPLNPRTRYVGVEVADARYGCLQSLRVTGLQAIGLQ